MAPRTQPRFRPSDLLPWADPHIRSLVEQLQQEVREEEAQRRQASPCTAQPVESDGLDCWSDFADEPALLPTGPRF